jgi:hypothetical protein
MAVQDRGLKPRHDIGNQQASACPIWMNPATLRFRDAGQENLIKIGAKVVRHGRYVLMPTKSPLSGARRADLTGFCVHRR